jgi:hypothetical protein
MPRIAAVLTIAGALAVGCAAPSGVGPTTITGNPPRSCPQACCEPDSFLPSPPNSPSVNATPEKEEGESFKFLKSLAQNSTDSISDVATEALLEKMYEIPLGGAAVGPALDFVELNNAVINLLTDPYNQILLDKVEEASIRFIINTNTGAVATAIGVYYGLPVAATITLAVAVGVGSNYITHVVTHKIAPTKKIPPPSGTPPRVTETQPVTLAYPQTSPLPFFGHVPQAGAPSNK